MYLIRRRNGIYYIEYYDIVDEKLKRVTTKTKNKTEANKFLSHFKVGQKKSPISNHVSLKRYEVEYCSFISSIHSKKYCTSVKLSFKRLIGIVGDISLNKVNNRLVENFILNVSQNAKHAAALYYRTLKAAFNKAIEWNYIQDNPFKKLKLPKVPKKNPVFLSIEELNKIIENTENQELGPIFATAFYTGMRLGELTNLMWRDVDIANEFIKISNTDSFTTKGKKDRIIPMSKKVKTVLGIIKSKDPASYVFSRNNHKYNEDYISKQFKKSVRKAKLNESIHFHSLRHSFASHLAQSGVSLYAIKELLGHEDLKTTQIYSHLQRSTLIEAIKVLN